MCTGVGVTAHETRAITAMTEKRRAALIASSCGIVDTDSSIDASDVPRSVVRCGGAPRGRGEICGLAGRAEAAEQFGGNREFFFCDISGRHCTLQDLLDLLLKASAAYLIHPSPGPLKPAVPRGQGLSVAERFLEFSRIGGMQAALVRQFDLNSRADFLQEFARQALERVVKKVGGSKSA